LDVGGNWKDRSVKEIVTWGVAYILLLTDSVEEFVETIGHHHVHANEVVDWFESTRREVTLSIVRLVLATLRALSDHQR
jgi:hypothetical protein